MFLKPPHKVTLPVSGQTDHQKGEKDELNHKRRMASFISVVVYTLIILITIALMLILFSLLIKVNIT